MLRSIILVLLALVITGGSHAQNKRVKKTKDGAYTYLDPNDAERAKHMRTEFVNINDFIDSKRLKKDNVKSLSIDEFRQRNIDRLKKKIEKYETFSDINEWENAVILSTKANLAKEENKFDDAINYLATIVKTGHVTEKTMSNHYYDLYNLLFAKQDYLNAQNFLMKAFSLKHYIMPWDFAVLSEISFRNNKHDNGVKLLTRAIDSLEANGCPVEDHWEDILKQNSNKEYILKLTKSTKPWFTSEAHIYDPLPIMRKEPIYPRKSAERRQIGFITLSGIIDEEGNVVCSLIIDGAGKDFLKPSQKAFDNFKYNPAIINGSPVRIYGIGTRFTFQMGGSRR